MTYAVSHAGVFAQLPNFTPVQFTSAYVANTVTACVTAGAANTGAPSKVVALWATNTDASSAYTLQLWITRSAVAYLLATITIPLSSGNTNAVQPVNILANLPSGLLPTDNDGQSYFFLNNGDVLGVSLTTQPASGKVVNVVPVAADL